MDDAVESVLIDLSELSLGELRSLSSPILREALYRVRAEAANPREVVAGFEACLPPLDLMDG